MLRHVSVISRPLITLVCTLCFSSVSLAANLCTDNFESYPAGTISGIKSCPSGTGQWNIDNMWSTASIVSGAGPDGSKAAKIAFSVDQLNRWFDYYPANSTSEFYLKFHFKVDCAAGTCAGGAKFIKVFGQSGGGNTTVAYNYNMDPPEFSQISYGCGGGDTASTVDLNGYLNVEPGCTARPVVTKAGSSINPNDGRWHTMQYHMKYNTPGVNDGVYELWYDENLVVAATGINNRGNSSAPTDHINFGGWNQNYGNKPYNIFFDNVTVSTTKITTSGTTLPAITNLLVLAK